MILALDTGVLGMVCHPRKHAEVRMWLRGILGVQPRDHIVAVPEIADYELRRELLRLGARASLRALDQLATNATYLPLDTATMRLAAELWAELRAAGLPTAAEAEIDADVILAAQARRFGATVVTENVRHLARLVPVVSWRDV